MTLAGFDLTEFLYDCGVSDNCLVDDYSDYDGYALVVHFVDDGTNFQTDWGFCLDNLCVIANRGEFYYSF